MEERFFTSQTFILRISLNSIVTCKFVIANLRVENKNKYYNDLLAWSIIKQHDDRKLQTTNDEVKRNVFWISKASLKKKTWSMHHWLEACSESNGGRGVDRSQMLWFVTEKKSRRLRHDAPEMVRQPLIYSMLRVELTVAGSGFLRPSFAEIRSEFVESFAEIRHEISSLLDRQLLL